MDVQSRSEVNPSYHLQYLCKDYQQIFCERWKVSHPHMSPLCCSPFKKALQRVCVCWVLIFVSPLPESKDETSPQSFSMLLCFCSLIKCKLYIKFEKNRLCILKSLVVILMKKTHALISQIHEVLFMLASHLGSIPYVCRTCKNSIIL